MVEILTNVMLWFVRVFNLFKDLKLPLIGNLKISMFQLFLYMFLLRMSYVFIKAFITKGFNDGVRSILRRNGKKDGTDN